METATGDANLAAAAGRYRTAGACVGCAVLETRHEGKGSLTVPYREQAWRPLGVAPALLDTTTGEVYLYDVATGRYRGPRCEVEFLRAAAAPTAFAVRVGDSLSAHHFRLRSSWRMRASFASIGRGVARLLELLRDAKGDVVRVEADPELPHRDSRGRAAFERRSRTELEAVLRVVARRDEGPREGPVVLLHFVDASQ